MQPLQNIINLALEDNYIIKGLSDNVYYLNEEIDNDRLEVFLWTLVKYKEVMLTRDLDGKCTGFIIL